MNLLMIGLDASVAEGKRGALYYMLEEFHRYWDRIDIITPPVGAFRCETVFDNVHFHPTRGGRPFRVLRIVRKARELFAQRRYDFIVAHDCGLFQNGRAAWRLYRESRVPYMSEIFHVPGLPRASNLREFLERRTTKVYLKLYGRRHPFFRVINTCETLPFLKEAGVPEERIRVVRSHFVDLDTYRPTGAEKTVDVVSVGRLVPNKGFHLVIEAVARLRSKRPSVKAAIVGEGPLRARLEALAARRGVAGNVAFLGQVPASADVAEVCNRARVMVMASYNEGGPRTAVEAMACGTPVVGTRVGLMHELIDDGVNGFFVDWDPVEIAERVEQLLDDEPLRKSMGEAGRASVQRFRREDVIRDYALACRRMAEEAR